MSKQTPPVVQGERGTWVYYRVVPSALAQLSAVLGSTHVTTAALSVTVPAVLA